MYVSEDGSLTVYLYKEQDFGGNLYGCSDHKVAKVTEPYDICISHISGSYEGASQYIYIDLEGRSLTRS
jgi:hypothetical protein